MLLVKRQPKQRFDDRLTADISLSDMLIEFLKHRECKVHVHALNQRHYLALFGEKVRDVLT